MVPQTCIFWRVCSAADLFLILAAMITFISGHASAATYLQNETDWLALLDLKSQIINDPQGVLNWWNDSQHDCKWQGVTCDARHQGVMAFTLRGMDLASTILEKQKKGPGSKRKAVGPSKEAASKVVGLSTNESWGRENGSASKTTSKKFAGKIATESLAKAAGTSSRKTVAQSSSEATVPVELEATIHAFESLPFENKSSESFRVISGVLSGKQPAVENGFEKQPAMANVTIAGDNFKKYHTPTQEVIGLERKHVLCCLCPSLELLKDDQISDLKNAANFIINNIPPRDREFSQHVPKDEILQQICMRRTQKQILEMELFPGFCNLLEEKETCEAERGTVGKDLEKLKGKIDNLQNRLELEKRKVVSMLLQISKVEALKKELVELKEIIRKAEVVHEDFGIAKKKFQKAKIDIKKLIENKEEWWMEAKRLEALYEDGRGNINPNFQKNIEEAFVKSERFKSLFLRLSRTGVASGYKKAFDHVKSCLPDFQFPAEFQPLLDEENFRIVMPWDEGFNFQEMTILDEEEVAESDDFLKAEAMGALIML